MEKQQDPTSTIVFIEGEMNIYRARELKLLLQAQLASAEQIDLDLAGVSEIDSAGLQLLLVAKQSTVANRQQLQLVAPSDAVRELLHLTGLAAYFDAAAAPAGLNG